MSLVSILLLSSLGIDFGLASGFQQSFWYFEPIVLYLDAPVMMTVAGYALLQAVTAVLDGGREVELGPAVIYTIVDLILAGGTALAEHRANRTTNSALVAMDFKDWITGWDSWCAAGRVHHRHGHRRNVPPAPVAVRRPGRADHRSHCVDSGPATYPDQCTLEDRIGHPIGTARPRARGRRPGRRRGGVPGC